MGQRGRKRNRLAAPTAVSVVALASLLGAPAASAQEVCVDCPEPATGTDLAFMKHAQLGFPGSTEDLMLKWEGANAFLKITELGFPGNTADAFNKH